MTVLWLFWQILIQYCKFLCQDVLRQGANAIILSKDIDKYAFMCGSNFYESDFNFMHWFKSAILAEWKNCQNGNQGPSVILTEDLCPQQFPTFTSLLFASQDTLGPSDHRKDCYYCRKTFFSVRRGPPKVSEWIKMILPEISKRARNNDNC